MPECRCHKKSLRTVVTCNGARPTAHRRMNRESRIRDPLGPSFVTNTGLFLNIVHLFNSCIKSPRYITISTIFSPHTECFCFFSPDSYWFEVYLYDEYYICNMYACGPYRLSLVGFFFVNEQA